MFVTPFDIIVIGVSVLLFIILSTFISVREGFLGIKTSKQVFIFYAILVFTPVVGFYTYMFWDFEPLEKQVYERYYGKFESILQVTGSSKYPHAKVKTSSYTLYDMETRYFKDVNVGDKIYYRAVGNENVISTYYVVGGRSYGVSVCYYPMSCWERSIEKFDFNKEVKDDISPYIRRP